MLLLRLQLLVRLQDQPFVLDVRRHVHATRNTTTTTTASSYATIIGSSRRRRAGKESISSGAAGSIATRSAGSAGAVGGARAHLRGIFCHCDILIAPSRDRSSGSVILHRDQPTAGRKGRKVRRVGEPVLPSEGDVKNNRSQQRGGQGVRLDQLVSRSRLERGMVKIITILAHLFSTIF